MTGHCRASVAGESAATWQTSRVIGNCFYSSEPRPSQERVRGWNRRRCDAVQVCSISQLPGLEHAPPLQLAARIPVASFLALGTHSPQAPHASRACLVGSSCGHCTDASSSSHRTHRTASNGRADPGSPSPATPHPVEPSRRCRCSESPLLARTPTGHTSCPRLGDAFVVASCRRACQRRLVCRLSCVVSLPTYQRWGLVGSLRRNVCTQAPPRWQWVSSQPVKG
jgi:hypothetical protein